jgi:hypothetical protein
MGQSPGTCGSGTARQYSAPQQLDSSEEWMFQGNFAFLNVSEVDWDHVNDPAPDEVRKGFPEVGEQLKASFSENSPAEIECIAIISDIAEVSCDVHQNEPYLGVPLRGYVHRPNTSRFHLSLTAALRCLQSSLLPRKENPKAFVCSPAQWEYIEAQNRGAEA